MARLRWPFLRRHRAEALSALALAAGAGEPLPQTLARLAADDPLLRPSAAALIPRLERGEALPAALRAVRLVTDDEARRLAEADGRRLAGLLARLAAGAGDPTPGYALVRWYPVWVAMAVVAPGVGLSALSSVGFRIGSGNSLSEYLLVKSPDGFAELASMPFHQAVAIAALSVIAAAAATWLISQTRGLRHLLFMLAPAVHRQAALIRLCHSAGIEDDVPRPARWWQLQPISATRDMTPSWDMDWRTLEFLLAGSLTTGERKLLLETPVLSERMRMLNIAPVTAEPGAWVALQEELESEYRVIAAPAVSVMTTVLALLIVFGFLYCIVGPFLNALRMMSSSMWAF